MRRIGQILDGFFFNEPKEIRPISVLSVLSVFLLCDRRELCGQKALDLASQLRC